VDYVLAIGPIPMMRAVAETTRPHRIRTMASLNPIMVDGTGMCGGCRVMVGQRTKFACVDGPEFDAHEVDFGALAARNNKYREAELLSSSIGATQQAQAAPRREATPYAQQPALAHPVEQLA
jgi:ferredoxin--NADP+ reductase